MSVTCWSSGKCNQVLKQPVLYIFKIKKTTIMARKNENGLISGIIGKTVFYEMYGNQYARVKPKRRKKKRNEPPNEITTVFGDVSRYGTLMMNELKKHLLFPFTLFVYNKQRAWMRSLYAAHKDDSSWELRSKHNLTSQINLDCDLRDIWEDGVTVVDEGEGIVTVTVPPIDPARDMRTPAGTQKITCKLFVLTSPFDLLKYPYTANREQYSFDHSNGIVPSQTFRMDTTEDIGMPTSGNIALVVIAFEFETEVDGKVSVNTDKKWLPAAIVAIGRLK